MIEAFEEVGVDLGAAGLAFGAGVVSLGDEGGPVLLGGEEHGAGFADRFVAAIELDGPAAVAVALESFVYHSNHGGHGLPRGHGGQDRDGGHNNMVYGLDNAGDLEVMVGDGAVTDAGVDHRHRQVGVAQ